MEIFYFEITPRQAAPTRVAIFAKTADNASKISGKLMLSIERYEPRYSGEGLALFRQLGRRQQLIDALATTTIEGLGGYTMEDGWTVIEVPQLA